MHQANTFNHLLEVCIDVKITWKDHISHITNELAKYNSILNRGIWTLDTGTVRQIYHTPALPCISNSAMTLRCPYYANDVPIFLTYIYNIPVCLPQLL